MIKVLPFANALAVVFAVFHTLGALLAMAAPGLFASLVQSWFLLDLSQVAVVLTLPLFLLGVVTAAIAGWLIGLVLAALYNVFAGVTTEAGV